MSSASKESLKQMTIEMHPSLLEAWFCGDVRPEALAADIRVSSVSSMCDPSLVMWTQLLPPDGTVQENQMPIMPRRQHCNRALYVVPAADLAERITEHTLSRHVKELKELVDCQLTLVMFGAKDYFKKKSGRQTQNSSRKLMTEIDLEMAITDLLVSVGCDTAVVDTPNELSLLIIQFTAAIAEAARKKAKRDADEQAEFYMRGDKKQTMALDTNGNGMTRLWQQMVAMLPQSSLEISRALCAEYKTPRLLYEAAQLPNCVNEIADIGVDRAGVPGVRMRRIGPEFARKLHMLFTSENGDALVD